MGGRVKKSARNARAGLAYQFVYIALNFAVRYAIIKGLGLTALSLNGLFSQVLGMLSLAEAGVGLAATYHLYKPLAEGDRKKISQVMNLLKRAYLFIALFILGAGLILTPWVHFLVKGVDVPLSYLRLVYVLFVIQTSVSYEWSYKALLLTADQNAYVSSRINIACQTICSLTELVVICTAHSYIAYLILEAAYQAGYGIWVNRAATRMYPWLDSKARLPEAEKKAVFLDVRRLFISRISNKVLNGTDNILLSTIVSTVSVGIYSQYSMIVNGILRLFASLNEAVVGSVGNIIASESTKRVVDTFNNVSYIFFVASLICGCCFYAGVDPLLLGLFGKSYTLSVRVTYIVVLNMMFEIQKMPLWTYYNNGGLFASDQWISLAGCILNIVVSIIWGKKIGMAGIFIGTYISLLLMFVLKLIVFSRHFDGGNALYIRWTEYLVLSAAVLFLVGKIRFSFSSQILNFICQVIPAGLLGLTAGIIPFMKTGEFLYFRGLVEDARGRFASAVKSTTHS